MSAHRPAPSGPLPALVAGLAGTAWGGFTWVASRLSPGVEALSGPAVLEATSWALVLAGIAGTGLAGQGSRWGWLLLLALQPVWVGYSLATGQHGFILGALAYGVAQLNGYRRAGGLSTGSRAKSGADPWIALDPWPGIGYFVASSINDRGKRFS